MDQEKERKRVCERGFLALAYSKVSCLPTFTLVATIFPSLSLFCCCCLARDGIAVALAQVVRVLLGNALPTSCIMALA